jgi:ABC-type lipoprotein export system ATPase subunit
MKNGNTKEYFAGGNTMRGFHSLFHYIPGPDTKRLIIIKGGPGTGKSTLMKQVGQRAREKGMDTELFYCSSDNQSLDGLSVPELGFAMVDGTAPHVIDPKIPGAYDEIVNLGDCWDAGALRPRKDEIAAVIQQNSEWFVQAYQYLRESAVVMDKMRHYMRLAMDDDALTKMTHHLLRELVAALPPASEKAQSRHLFGGAITPAGLVNFYPSILEDVERFYLLTGDPGSGKSTLLRQVYETVTRAGHSTQVYHCAFDPERLDAVVIPVIKTAFVKISYPHSFSLPPVHPVKEQYTLALSRYSRVSALRASTTERAESQERFWYLLGKAVEMIRSAKRNHDQLEDYYIEAMDFQKIATIRERLLCELLP